MLATFDREIKASDVIRETDAGVEINIALPETVADFVDSRSPVAGIRGPVGSGKTTGACMKIMDLAMNAEPCKDGVIRSRWVIVRNTYAELKSTTIQTWSDWFGEGTGEGFGKIVYDTPIRQEIKLQHPSGHDVEILIWFLAMDRPDHVKKLKSLEATGIWLNEASELPKAVLDMCTQREGRYPPQWMRPDHLTSEQWPTWHGVFMDTNSMDDEHWWYELAEETLPEGYEFFTQPGGLAPNAENLEFLPGGRSYYTRMMVGKSQTWIDLFVNNRYGSIYEGKPVYTEYSDTLHPTNIELEPLRGLPLYLGWDFGLTPACIFAQVSPRGQLRVLDEKCAEDMGIENFAEHIVKPHIANEYAGMKIISVGDPGGATRAETDERSCLQSLKRLGIPTKEAKTNLFTPRREAVAGFLSRLVDGKPAIVLSSRCKVLRKGFNGGYKYRLLKLPGEEKYTKEPDKNKFSHPHDGLQYIALELTTVQMGGRKRKRGKHYPGDSAGGY